ncbi:MAG: hypothetical protein E6J91_42780 [Deltaproteobacteria bacterium]|nr:MAG: hypothetical protein E6J91_42780 [Deltaproteobacteria bacterium]
MSRAEILEILLQRRFLSLAFVPLYELALDALSDPSARRIVRSLIREEYNDAGEQTHREHLVCDLLALGATLDQIHRSRPSATTLAVAAGLVDAMRRTDDDASDHAYQIAVLATLRLAGEVLVAVEYEMLWPQLQRLGLCAHGSAGKVVSRFYYPHMTHDARRHRIASDPGPTGNRNHADLMTDRLRDQLALVPAAGVEACLQAARRAQGLKRSFYDQWLVPQA